MIARLVTVARQKWTKSATDRWLGGVFGGLGAYLHINATILRVAYLVLAVVLPPHGLITLLAVILYAVLLWTLPSDHQDSDAGTFNMFGDLFSGQNRPTKKQRKQINAEERDIHKK